MQLIEKEYGLKIIVPSFILLKSLKFSPTFQKAIGKKGVIQ